jgi:menaquinone-dependent protoporphyrinogen oxidase
MRVLISTASKHGSTAEIGEAIGRVLRSAGLETIVMAPEKVASLGPYDAVVLGSAVYVGRWMDSATAFAKRHEIVLKRRPVWLFSSGPLGEPPQPIDHLAEVNETKVRLGARDHRVFTGRLDRNSLGLVERAMTAAVKAPSGDFRDWDDVEDWAGDIAAALTLDTAPYRPAAEPARV